MVQVSFFLKFVSCGSGGKRGACTKVRREYSPSNTQTICNDNDDDDDHDDGAIHLLRGASRRPQ